MSLFQVADLQRLGIWAKNLYPLWGAVELHVDGIEVRVTAPAFYLRDHKPRAHSERVTWQELEEHGFTLVNMRAAYAEQSIKRTLEAKGFKYPQKAGT